MINHNNAVVESGSVLLTSLASYEDFNIAKSFALENSP
jgi:hypothetical protein